MASRIQARRSAPRARVTRGRRGDDDAHERRRQVRQQADVVGDRRTAEAGEHPHGAGYGVAQQPEDQGVDPARLGGEANRLRDFWFSFHAGYLCCRSAGLRGRAARKYRGRNRSNLRLNRDGAIRRMPRRDAVLKALGGTAQFVQIRPRVPGCGMRAKAETSRPGGGNSLLLALTSCAALKML